MFQRKRRSWIKLVIITVCFFMFPLWACAETVKVGLEPMPPLINKDGTGYTVELFQAIEAISDIQFDIKVMVYTRAKLELKSGRIDLIAHTPYQLETVDFYEYAQDIDWYIETRADLYTHDKENFKNIEHLTIGIPRGNKEFVSQLLGISVANFYEGTLTNLLQMLERKRIDAFWFERASTMTTIQALHIEPVYYIRMPQDMISAGIAVRKDQRGARLKNKLDTLIKHIDHKRIFQKYLLYLKLPDTGIVTLDKLSQQIKNTQNQFSLE